MGPWAEPTGGIPSSTSWLGQVRPVLILAAASNKTVPCRTHSDPFSPADGGAGTGWLGAC